MHHGHCTYYLNSRLTDVPADASSVRYQLIKVVSKQAVR